VPNTAINPQAQNRKWIYWSVGRHL